MELGLSCSPDAMRRGIERRLTSIARVPSPAHDGRLKTYHAIVRIGLFASVRSGPTGNWRPTKSAATTWRRCSLASPMSARRHCRSRNAVSAAAISPAKTKRSAAPMARRSRTRSATVRRLKNLGDGQVVPDGRQRHLRLERRAVRLPCPLHSLLPRYPRFLGAGLHLSHLSHFRDPAQFIAGGGVWPKLPG